MKNTSAEWLQSLMYPVNRQLVGDDPLHSQFPIFPWITPWVHPTIVDLIEHCGIVRELDAGEPLFSTNEKISSLVYVISGVTARCLANPEAQSKQAIALAPPGHFAAGNLNFFSHRHAIGRYYTLTPAKLIYCPRDISQSKQAIALAPPGHFAAGNLNFFSHRHAIGRYYTLTPAKLIYCPRDILQAVIQKDMDLFKRVVIQFEMTSLSDRLGFACLSLLSAEERLKVLALIWAVNYGRFVQKDNQFWVKMPTPMSRDVRTRVTSTSLFWVDRTLKQWKQSKLWIRDGNWVYMKLALVEPIYQWIRHAGEEASDYLYPEQLETLIGQ